MSLLLRVKPKFSTLPGPPLSPCRQLVTSQSNQHILYCMFLSIQQRCWITPGVDINGNDGINCTVLHVCVFFLFFFTIFFGHETSRGEGQGRGAPAVSVTCASGVAVLPTFLLQLLQPVMHHLPGGGLQMQTRMTSQTESESENDQKNNKTLKS